MDYTLSPQHVVHPGTGQRMHEQNQPIPTQVTDKDLNSVIWSLMEVVKAAGMTGDQFDPSTPATYQRLLNALKALFIEPSELAASLPVAGQLARAWVTFNDSGSILASRNVTSVTRNSVGTYTIAFSAGTFSSAEYVAAGMCGAPNGVTPTTGPGALGVDNYLSFGFSGEVVVKTTSAFKCYSINKDTQSREDADRISLAFFGE